MPHEPQPTSHSWSIVEREAALNSMQLGVDVLIVGGGITGAWIGLDCATRGFRTAVVEKADFASGTSSRSTGLVHGGLRYLPQAKLDLVHEALLERQRLFANAPWAVVPLEFILPVYDWYRRPVGLPVRFRSPAALQLVLGAGLFVYDLFAKCVGRNGHRHLPRAEVARRAPALHTSGLGGGLSVLDGQTDDARLTLAVLKTAVEHGALVANYAEVTRLHVQDGQIRSASVTDKINGKLFDIPAREFVNAGGVLAAQIERLTGLKSNLSIVPAKGVHLVLTRDAIPMTRHAVILPETDDGRLLFIVPWQDRVVVGTTDTAGSDVDQPSATAGDIDYLIRHCNRYLRRPIARRDIVSTYAGYRPLIGSPGSSKTSELTRGHAVLDGPGRILSVVGGKLTTARQMAEDAVDKLCERVHTSRPCRTRTMALTGTADWMEQRDSFRCRVFAGQPDIVRHLIFAYGAHAADVAWLAMKNPELAQRLVADLPYIVAEVVYACRCEMAATLSDVLCRRTRLVLEDTRWGAGIARRTAQVMAGELGWCGERVDEEVTRFLQMAAKEHSVPSS